MSAEHIGGLVSITLCQIMEQIRPKTENPLEIFVLSVLLILCLTNLSNNLYHGTGGDKLSAKGYNHDHSQSDIRIFFKACFALFLFQILLGIS